MSDVKDYDIEFVYTDSGLSFRTDARMTDGDADRILRILGHYKKADAIDQEYVTPVTPSTQDFDTALGEIMSALEHEVSDSDEKSECQNCRIVWPDAVLVNPIPDLQKRVAPGEPMPSGECPSCGALCQPHAKEAS